MRNFQNNPRPKKTFIQYLKDNVINFFIGKCLNIFVEIVGLTYWDPFGPEKSYYNKPIITLTKET
jgi:hypothetical protein